MIKRIAVTQLRLGMHVHEFCGSWMDHPFWRSKFTLRKQSDLQRILDGGVKDLWIDTAKGADVVGGIDRAQVDATVERALISAASATVGRAARAQTGDEYDRAATIVRRTVPRISALFEDSRLGRAVQCADFKSMVEEISESVHRHPSALISVARLKQRDTYTYMHSVAVCALMLALGRQLGLRGDALMDAGLAGMMHDLGKVAIPLEVLNKPGKLTNAEFDLMKTHPERGHELLAAGHAGAAVLDVCLHHHEKIDGSGYPYGLGGEDISLLARMGAVCDVYDAVTSVRPYKDGWDPGEALRRMAQWTGHFDPTVFQAFVKTVGIYPVGSLVRLQSGRLAVVAAQSPSSLLTPSVKVFFSTETGLRFEPYILDLSGKQCQDKVVACESPEVWNFEDLGQLVSAA